MKRLATTPTVVARKPHNSNAVNGGKFKPPFESGNRSFGSWLPWSRKICELPLERGRADLAEESDVSAQGASRVRRRKGGPTRSSCT
jgi:hypothetical protein